MPMQIASAGRPASSFAFSSPRKGAIWPATLPKARRRQHQRLAAQDVRGLRLHRHVAPGALQAFLDAVDVADAVVEQGSAGA